MRTWRLLGRAVALSALFVGFLTPAASADFGWQ